MSSEISRVTLFVDLLGVRSRWLRGGREAAEEAFKDFRTLIASSLRGVSAEKLEEGLVESDSAALIFVDVETAFAVAQRMYLAAFERSGRPLWLRGCIVARGEDGELRRSTSYGRSLSQVKLMIYSSALFEAISVEKAGYKGMRLLVANELLNASVKANLKQPIGHLNFIPLCKLRNSHYPKRLDGDYVDFLWMGTCDRDRFLELVKVMAVRLRGAAQEPEEFVQAASTQVVFHECAAILSSLGGKAHYRELKQLGSITGDSTSE